MKNRASLSLASVPSSLKEVGGDDYRFLRRSSPLTESGGRPLRVADLFSGCGGISLGIASASRAIGQAFDAVLAVDADSTSLQTYQANFRPRVALHDDIAKVFDGALAGRTTLRERGIRRATGPVDVLVGGPPCQGHSDLNNRTRRSDPKNSLYLKMARAAEVLEPRFVVIENVTGAAHDSDQVVQATRERLDRLGYYTRLGILDSVLVGVPQKRRRLLLLASEHRLPTIESIQEMFRVPERDLRWAIGDMASARERGLLSVGCRSTSATRRRIEYLFKKNLYDLPDSMRPPCHRSKVHSYRSVYGRMRWDAPAQTITGGFYSMCMGRYVHPQERRTITAHEAARLQFFPDFFDFSPVRTRSALAQMIGNAVPMKLAYVAFLGALLGDETSIPRLRRPLAS